MHNTAIRRLSDRESLAAVPHLGDVLLDVVAGGASVSFMWPFERAEAETFWRSTAARVASGETILLVAEVATHDGPRIVGTVSVHLVQTPNQPHRFEIAKMLVHRDAQRQGIAAALMHTAETAALAAGRTVGVLDTVTGTAADRLYRRLGWIAVGEIPDYAMYPDGRLCPTTFFYKRISPSVNGPKQT